MSVQDAEYREEEKSTAVAVVPKGFVDKPDWDSFRAPIVQAFSNGLLPSSIKTINQAIIIALKVKELGIPTMYGLSQCHVINGKAGMSAELMLAQLNKYRPDIRWCWLNAKPTKWEDGKPCEWVQIDENAEAWIMVTRDKDNREFFSFTVEDAVRAGMLQKSKDGYKAAPKKEVWDKYRDRMLRARCVSKFIRAVAPEVIGGFYTPEELSEVKEPETEKVKQISNILENS